MKTIVSILFMRTRRWSCVLLLASPGISPAQVLEPATITVTTSFANPAGPVRSRLENPAGPGVTHHVAAGNTTEATPRTATTGAVPAASRTSGTAVLTVDAAGSPEWRLNTTMALDHYGEVFYSRIPAVIPTVPGGSYTTGLSTMVSIVDITFSQPVLGGIISARDPATAVDYAVVTAVPAGTRAEVVVPGNVPLQLKIAVETGAGGVTGSLRRVIRTVNAWPAASTLPGNVIYPLNVNISESGALGSFTGTFDVLGETELAATTVPTETGYSKVTAAYFSTAFPTYGTWERRTVIPGNPSSGPFTLANLPSAASIAAYDPGAGSVYGVQAQTFFNHKLPSGNYGTEYLRTRMQFGGELPAVPAGGTAPLGDRLSVTPGYLRGQINLYGPPAEPGRPALLSMIRTAADDDTTGDGIPDDAPPGSMNPALWLNKSLIGAFTAVNSGSGHGGQGSMLMERIYTAPNVACEYELALAGPGSETAGWTHPHISLVMRNNVTTEDGYFDTNYQMIKRGEPAVTIAPGTITTRDAVVEMGEVILTLRSASPAVNIWQPHLLYYLSGLTGAASNAWDVNVIVAFGWPTTVAGAAQRATLRTLLPAGTYTVRPNVRTVAGSNESNTTLAGFTITVPPRGRVTVDNGLSLMATVPRCVSAIGQTVNGSVNSDGATVTSIQYRVDGGALQNASFVPGVNPAYSFTMPGGLAPGMHTVVIIVTTADGRTASVTHQFERDVTPPVLTLPADIVIDDVPIGGSRVVNYPAPVVTDSCDPAPFVGGCNPPSGSVFPLGVTTVTCTARDAAGNTSAGSFTITLRTPCPPPVRSHSYAGNPDSHFTHPDKPAYHIGTAMTVEAWVKRGDCSRCETIVSQNYVSSFWFGFCPRLRFYRSGGAFADATIDVPEYQWTHVAVVYDGTFARFYINGVSAGTSLLSNAGTGANLPVTVGADFTSGSSAYEFKGHLDEVRIWNRARSPGDLLTLMNREVRWAPGTSLAAVFGSGGRTEDIANTTGTSGPAAPYGEVEGILPKYLSVPRTANIVGIDGLVNAAGEYAGAEKMVIRYQSGPAVRDGVAHLVYRDEPGDRALYVGITGMRDVIAPWTRAKSFVAVYFEPGPAALWLFPPQPKDLRFCRRLDGTSGAGFTPAGFQRGNGTGNFVALLPGDSLGTAPSPLGIFGAGGDTLEFRFDVSVLGGDWSRELRLGIAHHWISGVGADAGAPVAAEFDVPFTWADTMFAGYLPGLQQAFSGNFLNLTWPDPACGFILESSPNLAPASWTPVPSTRELNYRDDILRRASIDTSFSPRMFFRLRR